MSEGDARAALASARLWGSDRGPLWPPLAGGCRPLPGPPATCICLARAGRSGVGSGAVPASGLSSLFLPLPADFCQGRAERKKKRRKNPHQKQTPLHIMERKYFCQFLFFYNYACEKQAH